MRFAPALASALLLGAGCFSTPGFGGARDGSVGDDGGAGGDGGTQGRAPVAGFDLSTHRLFTTYFDMTFDEDNWMTPRSLQWASAPGAENFAFDTRFHEDAIGISFFKMSVSNALYVVDHGGTKLPDKPDAASFEVLETGPARATVRITWSGRSPCDSDLDPLEDNTMTFIAYPDGRLLRTDSVNTPDMPVPPGSCQPTVSVFNTFVGLRTLVYKQNGAVQTLPDPNNVGASAVAQTDMGDEGWMCLEDSHGALGYTWRLPTDSTLYKGVELLRFAAGAITFGYVLSEDSALAPGPLPVQAAMAMRPGSCTDLGMRLEAFQTPLIGGAVLKEDDAYHVSGAQVSPSVDVPAGTAFVFDLRDDVPQLELQGATLVEGTDFLAQAKSATGPVVVWLNKPMHANDVLKFDPN